jgi:hypothetical protein
MWLQRTKKGSQTLPRTFALAIAAACLAATGVSAAQRCPEQSVFDVEALKSEMMVLATACHDDTQYNAFVERYQPQLMATERSLDSYFRRVYGRRGQSEHDAYITSLANAQSDEGLKQGTDFCPRTAMLFQEAMALDGPGDLAAFAAGQDLVPSSLGSCQAPAAVHVVSTRRRIVHHVVTHPNH